MDGFCIFFHQSSGLTAVSLTAGKWKKCSLGRRTQPVCQLCTEQTECLFIASIPGWLT